MIEELSTRIFHNLSVGGIVLLSEDENLIARRLKSRDAGEISLDGIREHQEREIAAARAVARSLNVDLHHSHGLNAKQKQSLMTTLRGWQNEA